MTPSQRTVQIEVTEQDISDGRRRNCFLCPIALALTRTLQCKPAQVTDNCAYIDGKGFMLPLEAQQFIRQFDDFETVKPITFVMTQIHPQERQ